MSSEGIDRVKAIARGCPFPPGSASLICTNLKLLTAKYSTSGDQEIFLEGDRKEFLWCDYSTKEDTSK